MAQEIDYKVKFAQKYFDKGRFCEFDINRVDILLKDKKQQPILYIESKHQITESTRLRQARTQAILTNKLQKQILSNVALIYLDSHKNDILELIQCDDSVMFNNDINWRAETPSNPSKDAIDRINDRLIGKISIYKNEEIKELYKTLQHGEIAIHITLQNAILVFTEWQSSVEFQNKIQNEQDVINLFLVDMLNGTKYKKDFIREKLFLGEKS